MLGFVFVSSTVAILSKLTEPTVALALDQAVVDHVNTHATTYVLALMYPLC